MKRGLTPALLCAALLLIATWSPPGRAALPREANVPGGVALIPLGTSSSDAPRPRVWLDEQQVLVAADRGQWLAIVGLALDTPPGTHQLRVETGSETRRVSFTVDPKHYPEQHIRLRDTSKIQLSAPDLARVEEEIARIQRLKRHWRDVEHTDTSFVAPADGRMTGRFGVRRFFNGEARAPHAGFDIATPRGSVVRAGASGVVLAADDYFFNGRTVFVDHGNGLISMYCHLDRIDVQPGVAVPRGQQLGLSGMTGRTTGPHLHWSIVLNGAMVDPELFLSRSGPNR